MIGRKDERMRLEAALSRNEAQLVAVYGRRRYLASLGIPESSIVNLEYFDYARSKYFALGIPDTMPPKGT